MATDEGHNLLEPGHTPEENLQFLYFLGATLKAIHRHGGLLRAAIAFAGNDHRLGANEAPPAIMSAFLGSQLNLILEAIERGDVADASEKQILNLGLASLPMLEKDATDRNRTSPFAFTGNKFEFRAVGSSQAIAFPLTVINATVAEALDDMNARMEAEIAAGRATRAAAMAVIRETIVETRSIRFEGNNYSAEWRQEAEQRGLPHARDTVAALHVWEDPAAKRGVHPQGHPGRPRSWRRASTSATSSTRRPSPSRRRCCGRWPRPCCCRRSWRTWAAGPTPWSSWPPRASRFPHP